MRSLRIAVEGCGHGTLDAIYASVTASCEAKGWPSVDLLIIGGDFQAVRNAADLNCMAVPPKYRTIGDFHKYYSGQCKAPCLTLFVGGNHEASNHLRELYYGGWAAPNIYYLGAANVLRLGHVRIAGLSGIWKGYNFNKPHFERIPMNSDDVRSIYSVRELDVRKLLQLRSQVDVGLSHDWPRAIEWVGNHTQLFHWKKHLEPDARSGNLGSVAARQVLEHLRPPYWFSAHLHTKYAAVVDHSHPTEEPSAPSFAADANGHTAASSAGAAVHNSDEIDLDMDEDATEDAAEPSNLSGATATAASSNAIPEHLRAQLPASFTKPELPPQEPDPPTSIANTKTHFLALDKCLPGRDFLQLLEIPSTPTDDSDSDEPLRLHYDPEWLAITRAFSQAEPLQTSASAKPYLLHSKAHYARLIDDAKVWVHENILPQDMVVPDNFETTAPPYDGVASVHTRELPWEYNNIQTVAFCELLGIDNPVWVEEEDVRARRERGAEESRRDERDGGRGGGGRGWSRGGRGRGRGGRGGYGRGGGRGGGFARRGH